MSIHRQPPKFHELESETIVMETGIKVIDLLAPIYQRWKNWSFWWRWCGKNGAYPRTYS